MTHPDIRCTEHVGEVFGPRCSDCDRETVEEAARVTQARLAKTHTTHTHRAEGQPKRPKRKAR